MKNTGLRLAVAVAVLYSLFVSFMVTKSIDESTLAGASRILVSGTHTLSGSQGLDVVVQGSAQRSGSTIVREIRDLHDTSVRHFYLASGDNDGKEAKWLDTGFPQFSQGVSTNVHAATELSGVDPRGEYFIIGNSAALDMVVHDFSQLGYAVETERPGAFIPAALGEIFFGVLGAATLLVLLLVALLTGFSVLSRAKSYAILRLHGGNTSTGLKRDLRQELPAIALILAISFTAALIGLLLYNGWNQLGRYLASGLGLVTLMLLIVTCIYVAALLLAFDVKILDAIKGKFGFKVAVPATYLLRFPSIILAIALIASAFAASTAASQAQRNQESLADVGNVAKIFFEGLYVSQQTEQLAVESGNWLKEQDRLGHTIMVSTLAEYSSSAALTDEVLLVSQGYLQRNRILDNRGQQITDVPDDEVLIMIPEHSTHSAAEVERALLENYGGSQPPSISTQVLRGGQSHFLYGTGADHPNKPSYLEDVIVVGIGANSGFIADDGYMSLASRGQLLMADAEQALNDTPKEFLGTWISAYLPIAQLAAEDSATLNESVRFQTVCAVVALLVLLATAVGMAQIHVRGNAQLILVRYLHGWSFWSTHRWLFKAEAVLLGVAVVWALISGVWTALRAKNFGEVSHVANDLAVAQWQPVVVLGVALLNVLLLLVVVRVKTQSLIRTHSEETA
ncbi:hypothetical protein [Arthrobacter sp. MYb213]|uniref:hypothetical protein n=1 Tax=Arthrobacter sp. MYb213 TaxID=1848595 RepID=UPI000CFB179C|nr:hypothetical protein [Arthrobacter sp. MYb213]PRB69365.1 hypothetical protein CQ011_11340 [Arthrobacter sp. MYb213]